MASVGIRGEMLSLHRSSMFGWVGAVSHRAPVHFEKPLNDKVGLGKSPIVTAKIQLSNLYANKFSERKKREGLGKKQNKKEKKWNGKKYTDVSDTMIYGANIRLSIFKHKQTF